jgi:hypothetical protein
LCFLSTLAFAASYSTGSTIIKADDDDDPVFTVPLNRQIDKNGVMIDPTGIDPRLNSYTIKVAPNTGANQVYVSIPAATLAGVRIQNPDFIFIIEAPCGIYRLPVDIGYRIMDVDEGILRFVSFRVTLTDKSADKKLAEAFQKFLPHAKPLSGFVDFKLEMIETDSNEVLMQVTDYEGVIERLLPVSLAQVPDYYGVYCYTESTNSFGFTPHSVTSINEKPYLVFKVGGDTIHVAAENTVAFNDVPSNIWYTGTVKQAAAKALVRGVGNNNYEPNRSVTRAEFAQMITNALLLRQAEGTPYVDVTGDQWYANAIARTFTSGLLGKFAEKNFYPSQPITREEIATILAAVLRKRDISSTASLGHFAGSVEMTSAYMEDIALVFGIGLMQGVSDDKFDPKGVTTRAQAATVLIRLLETLNMIDK